MTYDNLVQHIPTSSHALRAMNEGCSSVHQELLLGMWDGHCTRGVEAFLKKTAIAYHQNLTFLL